MTDWQIPAALRNFGSVSQGVYVRKGSQPELPSTGLMSALASCGHNAPWFTAAMCQNRAVSSRSKIAPIALSAGHSIWTLQARAERSRVDSQIGLVWHRIHRTRWP